MGKNVFNEGMAGAGSGRSIVFDCWRRKAAD